MWFGDPSITDPYQRYGGNQQDNGTLMYYGDEDYGDSSVLGGGGGIAMDDDFWNYYWDVIDGPQTSGAPDFTSYVYSTYYPDDAPVLSGYDPFDYSDPTWNILFGGNQDVPVYPDPVTQQCDCSAAVAAAKAACPSTKPSGSDSGTKPSTGGSGGGASLPATNGNCPQGYQKYGNLCIAPQQQQAAKKDNTMLWLIIAVIAIWVYQES